MSDELIWARTVTGDCVEDVRTNIISRVRVELHS